MGGQWRGEGAQHQGARPYQEDSLAVKQLADGSVLAVLADGMGGHAGGAIASRVAVDTAAASVEKGASLGAALQMANRAVGEKAASDPSLTNMGTTFVAVTVNGDEMRWVSVGDSPLYLVAGGRIERLNADHSMAPQIDAMVERGLLTARQAANHPSRHTLREAVMGQPLTLIDEGSRRLAPGARLLLCSDGVQSLDDAVIAAGAGGAVRALIETVLAVRAAHQDNVTVIKLEREE
jgi:serine/threonine protein phosphatase PrpC